MFYYFKLIYKYSGSSVFLVSLKNKVLLLIYIMAAKLISIFADFYMGYFPFIFNDQVFWFIFFQMYPSVYFYIDLLVFIFFFYFLNFFFYNYHKDLNLNNLTKEKSKGFEEEKDLNTGANFKFT